MKKLLVLSFSTAFLACLPSEGSGQAYSWPVPVSNYRVGCVYFDAVYRRTEDRQHLGIDLPVTITTDRRGRLTPVSVTSPVKGRVVRDWTDRPVNESVLVITDDETQIDHVLGHISSSLRVGDRVRSGQVVGTVKRWITPNGGDNTHVHWGANHRGIAFGEKRATSQRDLSTLGGGTWGWGRAPRDATLRQAFNRGWLDLINYVRGRPNCR